MILNFKKLILKNFLSFQDAEFNLENRGYTLISGVNNCATDNAKSNGSGKSSIAEGIVWALTGETIRGTKDIKNKLIDEGSFVQLVFAANDDDYEIIRYKDYGSIGTNLKIFKNGIDVSGKGIRDTEKLLEQYLPDLTSSLIGSVIILGQGLPQRFTNNTPSGRKEVLEKLSKSDFMIEDIKDRLSKRKLFLSQELRKYEDLVLSDTSKLPVLKSQLVKLQEQKADLEKEDFDSNINILTFEVNKLEEDVKLINESIEKFSEAKTKDEIAYNTLYLEFNNKKSDYIKEFNNTSQPYLTKIADTEADVRSLKAEITRLESIKDICPTCGQKLPDVHKVDTTELRNKLAESNILLEKYKQEKLDKEKQDDLIYTQFESSYLEEIKQAEEEKNKSLYVFNDQVHQLSCLNSDLASKKTELNYYINKKESFIKTLSDLENNIKSLEEQIKQIDSNILYNNIEKDNVKSRQDVVNKMLTIATRDFRGFLLSEVISFIDRKTKEYCKDIFKTEEIEFKLDGNNIYIGYCGKQYENLSGGEKQKIDLIIQFSIRDMLSQYLNFNSNILFLDEIFDNLDMEGCQNVLNMITNKLTNIDSVFIITHHTSDLMIPYDDEILVVKDVLGISRLG